MEERLREHRGAILAGTMISVLIAALDNTLVGTAMPAVIRDLGDAGRYSWPFTAQLIAETATVPVAGKLSDTLGRKPVVLAGIFLYLAAALACGLAGSMAALSAFRVLAGIGGGILISSSFAIVAEVFPVSERGKYIGLVASMFSLASLTGPLVGGFVTEAASWRWAFFVSVPLALVAFVLIARTLPDLRPDTDTGRFDTRGILLFLTAAVPFLLAISEGGKSIAWGSPLMVGLFALAAVSLALFARRERRAENPLLPPPLFRNRTFRAATAAAFIAYIGFFGCVMFIPLLAQEGFGLDSGRAGLLLLPLTIGMMTAGNVGGVAAGKSLRFRRIGCFGFLLAACGAGVLVFSTLAGSVIGIIAGEFLVGLGVGSTFPVYNMASQFVFPLGMVGVVTALIEFFQDLGGAIGSSVLGALESMRRGTVGLGGAVAAVFVASAVIFILGAGLMGTLDDGVIASGMREQGNDRHGR